MTSEARVATPKASIYMKQLCRHFGHRLPAEFTDSTGRIEFEFGVCELAAEDGTLVLRAEAADGDSRERLEQVIASHLQRFAHRDELQIAWSPAGNP
jgi:hypothetical protein